MNARHHPTPVLILTYGNPSRGDDALGPVLFDMLEAHKQKTNDLDKVDLLTDFQLQIEHAIDLENRQYILFVDAGWSCAEPFELRRLQAEKDDTFTTHAMSPAAVLSVYRQINRKDAPPACLLTIRGYEFGLGLPISEAARKNLESACRFIIDGQWIQHGQLANSGKLIQGKSAENSL
jgi:hydrogenase maturation protease